MAKSKRSKVKMAYKAMRRQSLQPKEDIKLRKVAAKNYRLAHLPLPSERAKEQRMAPRTHNGMELVTLFTPTPVGPKLNLVHGPLAGKEEDKDDDIPLIGIARPTLLPEKMDAEEKRADYNDRPYFYPRRRKDKRSKPSFVVKRSSRHPQNKEAVQF